MLQSGSNRRTFLKSAAGFGAAAAASVNPYWLTAIVRAEEASKPDRHIIGCIGTGDRWKALVGQTTSFAHVAAICDADQKHLDEAQKIVGEKAERFEDYRRVLDRKEIEAVIIATPDHWHSKIAIEAMQAGKDVYCEKPLTLTIDEGKKICQVQKQTGRVFQVGTQQRSEFATATPKAKKSDAKKDQGYAPEPPRFERQFLQAVALARSGRLGNIKRVTCSIGDCKPCPPLPKVEVPSGLNWDLYLGQAPLAEYVQGGPSPSNPKFPASRCHYEFRWWYEYSGGKLTDWGAHHVDIAQWAIGMDHSGPTHVEATADLPVPFDERGYPTVDNQYNTASTFNIKYLFPGGIEMIVRDGPDNGVWIEGDQAEIFVNREKLMDKQGAVIAELREKPLPESVFIELSKGKSLGSTGNAHMRNFFECIRDRSTPTSDVFTHHRAITTCHLANIAIRLKRPLRWDPDKEEIVGDNEANAFLAREQRKGYEIKV